jgi:hypothetical protein
MLLLGWPKAPTYTFFYPDFLSSAATTTRARTPDDRYVDLHKLATLTCLLLYMMTSLWDYMG